MLCYKRKYIDYSFKIYLCYVINAKYIDYSFKIYLCYDIKCNIYVLYYEININGLYYNLL